ncbi:MAG: domain S-box, partial [Verrucomicrobiaceae bacterium]|nr:domain S-box [Verrucomicrobiaceae bacterium]
LVRRGYEVRSAESVTAALKTADDFDFDVLVTDIGLPDGSGVGLFESLRQKPAHKDIQGVAVSGFGMDEDIARSKQAGFTEHLTKPIDFSMLERCLARLSREEPALSR